MTFLIYGTPAVLEPEDGSHSDRPDPAPRPPRDDVFLLPDAATLEAFLAPFPSMEDRIQQTSEENGAHLDFGGSMLMGTEPVEIEVGGDLPGTRRISFYAHQHLALLVALNTALESESDEGLVEVRGWIHTLVLDRAAAEDLRSGIQQCLPTLHHLEHDYLDRWAAAMTDLRGSGFVHFEEEKEPDA